MLFFFLSERKWQQHCRHCLIISNMNLLWYYKTSAYFKHFQSRKRSFYFCFCLSNGLYFQSSLSNVSQRQNLHLLLVKYLLHRVCKLNYCQFDYYNIVGTFVPYLLSQQDGDCNACVTSNITVTVNMGDGGVVNVQSLQSMKQAEETTLHFSH